MKNILIADAGSTKVEWAVVSDSGQLVARTVAGGINALMSSRESIESELHKVVAELALHYTLRTVYYYGAGCATLGAIEKMQKALSAVIASGQGYHVASDMEGAALSLLGDTPGIACILGTGSNSCYYDGRKVVENVPPLGYILGDEGSGASLGKRFVADVLKGWMPDSVAKAFFSRSGLTPSQILENVYRLPGANRFLASFAPFIRENLDVPEVRALVLDEFTRFIKRNVSRYKEAAEVPVSFTGSIARHFREVLEEALHHCGFTIGVITPSPIDGLIKYHGNRLLRLSRN